ncbi:bifunctional diguanylate cyclase/phosphohydrolase [Acetobacterium bakii]|uniref:bifunctional diguanylate cyclase/phosphohydrolase n=1 Tax=Acetobacterium bakii TaxID=52689 RepID=UPI00068039A6|nr:HD-GYP domain-containing protein [Acetobacterium bakii]
MEKIQVTINGQIRLVLVSLCLITIMFVAVYFNYYRGIDVVYTHLFYVVIIMVGIWFKRFVIQLAIFLGIFHIILDYLSNGFLLPAPILRGFIFLFVAAVVYLLTSRLECTHENLNRILRSVGDGIIVVDLEKKVTLLNKVAEDLTGWPGAEALGKDFKEVFDLRHENPEYFILNPVDEVLKTDLPYELTNHAIITSRNGNHFHIEDSATPVKDTEGITTGVVLIFRDVSQRKAQNEKIEFLSDHDELTGLYNRHFFKKACERLDNADYYPLSIIMGDVNSLKMTNDAFGHLAGDGLLKAAGEIMNQCCGNGDVLVRWGGDEFVLLLPNTDEQTAKKQVQMMNEAMAVSQAEPGILSVSFGWATKYSNAEAFIDIFKKAENLMYKNKLMMKPEVIAKTVNTIMASLFQKSETEKIHADGVGYYCKRIAEAMALSAKDMDTLRTVSLLHDIGKVTVEKEILEKTGKLTGEEWKVIKRHPEIGYHITNTSPDMAEIASAILCHHERWDGTGYPKGLVGEQIPVLSRIIAVGAAYDTILSQRSYKQAWLKDDALAEIRSQAGFQFDPQIAALFVNQVADTLDDV